MIPRSCARCRLDAFDAIEALISADALREIDEMIAGGWDVAAAREAVDRGYREWVTARIDGAVQFALEHFDLEPAA